MKELRVGLIGCGVIAHEHVRRYRDIEGVEIVAACDINGAKLNDFCDRYGISGRYADYRQMLRRDDMDAVDVCLHNNLHLPLSAAVLRGGFHCYCEKPMAGAYADAVRMKEIAGECGKMLHIQLGFLYTEVTHAAKRFIGDGRLGRIYHARSYGYRRRGRPFVDGYAEKEFNSRYWAAGGALYDMGVYHLSQLLYLLGLPKLERVCGQVYQELEMNGKRRAESGFDVEELGVGLAAYEGGLTLDILESWAVHAVEFPPSMLMGSLGGLALSDKLEYLSELSGYPARTTLDLGAEMYRTRQTDPSLRRLDCTQKLWASALRGEEPPFDTAEIALATMLVSEGIYLSGKLGREVTVAEIADMSVSTAIKSQETPFGVLRYEL